MGAPFSLEDTLRRHDEAFATWLGGLTVDYGTIAGVSRLNHPIIQTMAAPQRAFAETYVLLVKQGWISGADADARKQNAEAFPVLPLPIASWERGEPATHPEHSGVPKRLRRQYFNQSTQGWETHPWPATYQIEYRLTLWCQKRYTEAHMREWLMSQLGKLGAGETEVFLPVNHGAPWGTLRQALKFESSSDLSTLEGESDQRYLRFEYGFRLNALHFRLAEATSLSIDTISPTVALIAPSDGVLEETPTGALFAPAVESGNLYQPYTSPALVASAWPKAGDATVGISTLVPDGVPKGSGLVIEVEEPTDVVDLSNRPLPLSSGSGHGVLKVSFRLLSDDAVGLDVFQNDGQHAPGTVPAWQSCLQATLPATSTWKRGTFFALVTQPIFDVSIRGTGTPATARFANLNIRRIIPGTEIAPTTGPVVVGSDNVFVWTGLAGPFPHLVVVEIGSGTGNATVEDDDTAPDDTQVKSLSFSQSRGAVFLVQPQGTSLVLRVDSAVSVVAAYAQRYDAPYAGHEL